jgi:glycerophosphoryl diester phosphodiesterase
MRLAILGVGLSVLALASCAVEPPATTRSEPGRAAEAVAGPERPVPFDLQGHRGARGLAPENTLEGFAAALEIGVSTLELDVRLTRDGVPVVIHDSRPNPEFTRIDGAYVDAEAPAIASLTLDEVRRFDVGRAKPGSRYARQFPDQVPHDGAKIPTLAGVFSLARRSSVRFNVETKVDGGSDTQAPDADADVVVRAIIDAARRAGVLDRITIQSFDWRTLEAAARIAPGVELSCLTVERWWETSIRGDPCGTPDDRKAPTRRRYRCLPGRRGAMSGHPTTGTSRVGRWRTHTRQDCVSFHGR